MLSQSGVTALAVNPQDPNTLLAGIFINEGPGQGIHRSTDGGSQWQLASGLTGTAERLVYEIAYDPADPLVVYAATEGGLRISFDSGQSWQPYPGSMGQIPIKTLAVTRYEDQTHLYLGTVGGALSIQPAQLRAAEATGLQAAQAETLVSGGVYVKQMNTRAVRIFLPVILRN